MKYWGYLVAKLAVVAAIIYAIGGLIQWLVPRPADGFGAVVDHPFGTHLGYTAVMMVFFLVAVALTWLAIWDQRYRCRTCVRRLRMPIATGDWTHVLMGRPRTEYICPYGHGTLKVEELQITGHQEPDWKPHDDIWKELFGLEETKK